MKANVGGLDKFARIILGALLIALAFTDVIGAWGYVGVIALLTGVLNFCGLYTLLGVSTCKLRK